MENLRVREGSKIGDVDPRGIGEYCFTISNKARAIGGQCIGSYFKQAAKVFLDQSASRMLKK